MSLMLYNFPFEKRIGVTTYFPTVAKLPKWMTEPRYRAAVALPGRASVRVAGPYTEEGLGRPLESPDAPSTMDWDTIISWSREIAPIEDPSIVEWMYSAHAANVVISARMEEYKRLGSSLVGASDDPFIPGLKVEDLRFRSELGREVAGRGYAILETPRGSVNVPVPGKATAVFSDLIAWGAVLEAFLVQWTGVILKWRELATNPSNRIAFPSFRGLVAPQFFVHSSSIPAPVNIARFSISTNRAQTIIFRARNINDYTDVMFEDRIGLAEGQNVVELPIFGFPVVPAFVVEIQPEDGTKTILDDYEVMP